MTVGCKQHLRILSWHSQLYLVQA